MDSCKAFCQDHLYIKESNTPMCGDGEDPTINNAAKWLAEPKNQEILFSCTYKVYTYGGTEGCLRASTAIQWTNLMLQALR